MANDSLLQKLRALLDNRGLRSESELTGLHKFVCFWVLLGKSFVHNRCPVRAAALSYTTLLALIPMLAVAISVTSSLLKSEGEERIYKLINKVVSNVMPPATLSSSNEAVLLNLAPSMSVSLTPTNSVADTNAPAPLAPGSDTAVLVNAQKQAAKRIDEFIQNTRSGTLGVTGMVLLVFVAIRMLASIEATFNDIWGVARGRNWLVRIVLYWATISLGPLLLIGALSLTGGAHFMAMQHFVRQMPLIGSLTFQLLPLAVLWLTFAVFYQLVPNTRVHFGAALVGGMVSGTAWHVNNMFGFLYVSRVVSNSKIYGSLALVPVFMLGLYFSWLILLFGAQVAYAFQNRAAYLQEKIAENVDQRGREFIALRLLTCIGGRFQQGLSPATLPELSDELGVPTRLVRQVLQTLVAAQLIIEVQSAEPGFTPARPLENINAHHVLQAMRAANGQELITRDEPAREEVYGEFARIQEAEKQAASAVTMLALVQRARPHGILDVSAPKPMLGPGTREKQSPS